MTQIRFYHLNNNFCNSITILALVYLLVSFVLINSTVPVLAQNSKWQFVPLRSPQQKVAGLPGGEGFQQVQAIAYAPNNPAIVYIGVDTSQVWKSTDGGFSWRSKKKGFLSNGALSLTVDPQNPDIVFAAGSLGKTYEEAKRALNPLQGIYRTIDGGERWELVRKTDFYKSGSKGTLFVFDTSLVNAGRTLTVYAGSHNEGLLRSLDGGSTWEKLNFTGQFILDIKENPARQGELFIATQTGLYKYSNSRPTKIGGGLPGYPRTIAVSPQQPSIVYAALGKAGVFKSQDQGITFNPAGEGLPSDTNYTDISASPVNADILYLKADQSKLKKPYYSHNGALDWHRANSTNHMNLLPDEDGFWFSCPFAPHPTEMLTALTVSNGRARIMKTTDRGKTWAYSGSGYGGGRMLDISFSKETILFFLVDHGIWQTCDNGDTFTELRVKRIFNHRSSASGDINGDTIVASIGQWGKKGLTVSHDRGESWKIFKTLVDIFHFISFHPQRNHIVYAGPYRSDDKGNSWKKLPHTIRAMYPQNGDIVYAILPRSKNKCIVTKSVDHGNTWMTPYPICFFPKKSVQDIAIAPDDPNHIYMATYSGVWIFNGSKWLQKGHEHGLEKDYFGGNFIRSIAVDPSHPNVVYAGKMAPGRGPSNGIFQSLDKGETWKNITYDLGPELTVWSIRINPQTSEVFIGTSLGTYKLNPLAQDLQKIIH